MPTGLRRYSGQGRLHFITFSCYRRLPLLKSARARDVFVRELARVRDELGFGLVGYVVMPEHVHLLMSEPPRGTPSTVLQKLKLRVARKMRKRRKSAPPGQMRLPFEECGGLCGRFGRRGFTILMCIANGRGSRNWSICMRIRFIASWSSIRKIGRGVVGDSMRGRGKS